MGEFAATMNYNFFSESPPAAAAIFGSLQQIKQEEGVVVAPKVNEPPPPPPVVICPSEVDHINITLEKNQQCQCKDCGKLFNSVWYLKQHAVKHSNDRPFKCKFCFKTYKFRSNLYQHKCPDRQKHLGQGGKSRLDTSHLIKSRNEATMSTEELSYHQGAMSDNEENDIPITYGLLIHKFDDLPAKETVAEIRRASLPSVVEVAPTPQMVNCVRNQQLPEHEIETYISENKNRLHTCRKCRLLFPTEASLLRHSAAHSRDDMFPYKCANCRQAFETHKELQKHATVHTVSAASPWKCDHCCGVFKSSPALRRHKDQCRSCDLPTEQSDILVSVHSPLDPFSFIPGDTDPNFTVLPQPEKAVSPDSGVENSPEHRSPEERSSLLEVDPYEIYGKKREKEDDEDSGFRSRLNSVTQSSPGSSVFSGEGSSPHRKHSDEHAANHYTDGFGGSANFVSHQPLFGDFESNEFTEQLLLDQQRPSTIWGH